MGIYYGFRDLGFGGFRALGFGVRVLGFGLQCGGELKLPSLKVRATRRHPINEADFLG